MTTATPTNQSPALYRVVVAVLAVLAVAGVIGLLAEVLGAQPIRMGSGRVTVDGDVYEVTAVTCYLSDDEFTAAGFGFRSEERHWVSASNVTLDLVVGTDGPLDRPTDDQLWLISDEVTRWQVVGRTVTAEAVLSDPRRPDATVGAVVGTLELSCDEPTA